MLTQEEMVKCRHHLGYPNVGEVQTFAFGVPAAMQTTFMIEGAMVRVLPNAEAMLRDLLAKLDKDECRADELLDIVEFESIEQTKYRDNALQKVAQHYLRHQQSLSNLLGIVPNPWDQREWVASGSGNINVPVQG